VTSTKTVIELDERSYERKKFELRLIISYGGCDIYDSGTSLFRNALCFDDTGRELTHRENADYVRLVTAQDADVEISDDVDYTLEDGYGQVFRVFFDATTQISVNNELVLSSSVSVW